MSQLLVKTEQQSPADAEFVSHQLLLRGGFIRQVAAGIYSLTPLAWRAMQKITAIAREEMNRVGAQELLLPVAQPAALWRQTGRYESIDESLVRFRDRGGQDMVLAMTHEEAVTDLARHVIQSYRQLPIMLYQVQTKFRDEARPRGGLIRLREFIMKDAYSFHQDDRDLAAFYALVAEAYASFYARCGIAALSVESDTGMMGGGSAHEFMMLSESGEDTLLLCEHCSYAANREVYELRLQSERECPKCGGPIRAVRGIEVGNIFQLGTKYSEPMTACFTDAGGVHRPLAMGCYGIGVSRMLSCIVEANHDGSGIIWPASVAPYPVHLVSLGSDDSVQDAARQLYAGLGPDSVLWDDRSLHAGRKFHDADLLGMPLRVTVSPRSMAAGGVEVRDRRTGHTRTAALEDIVRDGPFAP